MTHNPRKSRDVIKDSGSNDGVQAKIERYQHSDTPPTNAILEQLVDGIPPEMRRRNGGTTLEIDRVRRFMIHCLAVDYKLPCVPPLQSDDKEHFFWLGLKIHKIGYYVDIPSTSPGTDELTWYLQQQIYYPAAALNLPSIALLHTIYRHNVNSSFEHRYQGCFRTLAYNPPEPGALCRLPRIGAKLLMDKHHTIEAVVPLNDVSLREALFKNLAKQQSVWFSSLSDIKNYELTDEGRRLEKKDLQYESVSRFIEQQSPLQIFRIISAALRSIRGKCKGKKQKVKSPISWEYGSRTNLIDTTGNECCYNPNDRRSPDETDGHHNITFEREVNECLTVTIASSNGITFIEDVEADRINVHLKSEKEKSRKEHKEASLEKLY